ncbi:MAG TPA: FAD-dependent monooxygenase [Luteitalea sp.]|nr:FAD-dependent monooxygenase [Luteitalea sp.]
MPDVVVSGGGPAGAFAALVLARAGARVVLVDRDTFPRHKLCGDTLNPGAIAVLRQAGLADPVEAHGLPLDGMVVTGSGGVRIRGTYGGGMVGRAWARHTLDAHLLGAAADAGVDVRTGVRVVRPSFDATGRVDGIVTRQSSHGEETCRARWTIAADGRRSPLALAAGLIAHPRWPRRWAIGTYVEGVTEVGAFGEMHVRAGHYIGLAPAADGCANVCLVTGAREHYEDPGARLWGALRQDPMLRDRFAMARQVAPVVTLGPLAVDARAPGIPGLLLAGDAAGFVDPMTGDGLHLALRGALLAADVLVRQQGVTDERVVRHLADARSRELGGKQRFNRVLRRLVGWPLGLRVGALGAACLPAALRHIIATAGDVGVAARQATV